MIAATAPVRTPVTKLRTTFTTTDVDSSSEVGTSQEVDTSLEVDRSPDVEVWLSWSRQTSLENVFVGVEQFLLRATNRPATFKVGVSCDCSHDHIMLIRVVDVMEPSELE